MMQLKYNVNMPCVSKCVKMLICNYDIFLDFAENIDCGKLLENEAPQSMF